MLKGVYDYYRRSFHKLSDHDKKQAIIEIEKTLALMENNLKRGLKT